jgi:hypothetical protein
MANPQKVNLIEEWDQRALLNSKIYPMQICTKIPYTDELFFRFLDNETKSDGKTAETGVVWKMTEKDKIDLLAYLKTLN